MLRSFRLLTILALMGTIVAASLSPSWGQGPRLRVRVDEPFEVAGQVYPSGILTLRSIADYNPGSSIDEIWVGSLCIGALVADKIDAATVSQDTVLFERNRKGRLVLVGYLLRGQGTENSYRYRPVTIANNRNLAETFAIR